MVRTLASLCLFLLVAACGQTVAGGADVARGGAGGDGGTAGTPGHAESGPIGVSAPIELIETAGITSHALAATESDVVVVASREEWTPDGFRSILAWTLLDADGSVRPAAPLDLGYHSEVVAHVAVGSIAVDEPYALVVGANETSLVDVEFDLIDGGYRGGGGASSSGAPDLPFRPTAVQYALGYLTISNGWDAIIASVETQTGSASYEGCYRGFDPFLVRAGGRAWLGWNDTAGARVAPLQGLEPPSPVAPVDLGPAANGPVLAAGPDTLLALTWGDSLEARLVALDPPSVIATAAVTAGPISGRPAAVPWDGGFLVLWADGAGTTLRGRLLDATGAAVGEAAGLPLVSLDEQVSFEPTHAAADAAGAWLSWETSAGLRAVRLSHPAP
jgi:hypothetical protein